MPSKRMEFIIGTDGRVTERVVGIKGVSCEAATRLIEQSLGRVDKRDKTGEYYEQDGHVQGSVHTSDQ